ncbi:Bug family tripartite tricarboxylate transporter substrate binding protein [Cupriavidus sp. CP313]
MLRRALICGLSTAFALACPAGAMAEQAFPDRPIKLTVGFAAGSSTDVVSRIVAKRAGEILKQPVIVDNRPGASSSAAARAVAASPPDGYTLFVVTVANAINANSRGTVGVDLPKSFVPITLLGRVPNVLVVHPSLNAKSLQDFISLAKSKPGQLSYASSGIGTSPHLAALLFDKVAGVEMLHVPYKGSSEAMTDLLAGRVNVMFAPASTVMRYVNDGKLTALATAGAHRSPAAPKLATLAELGLRNFESSVWFGVVAPAGTPAAVQTKLAAAFHEALKSEDVKAQLGTQGFEVEGMAPQAFAKYMLEETDKWGRVMKDAGIKLN